MKKLLVNILFFSLLILTFGLGSYFSTDLKEDVLTQKKVVLHPFDKRFIEDEEVLALLKLKDSSLSKIKVEEIEKKLITNPYIANAEVYMDLNNRLYAYIEQYQPVARIIGRNSYYIDKDGNKKPLSKHYTENVILVFGNLSAKQQKEVYELIQKINADPVLKEIVTEIHLNNGRYSLRTQALSGNILFGDLNNSEEKLEKLKAIYAYLTKKKLHKKYHQLNLTYHNQVVCN